MYIVTAWFWKKLESLKWGRFRVVHDNDKYFILRKIAFVVE